MILSRRLTQSAVKASNATRALSSMKLPDLPYDFGDLAPVISAQIMELHHSKHHNAYVTNGNVALEKLQESLHKGDNAGVIAAQAAIRFNCGGHINHSIFWKNLCNPKDSFLEDGELKTMIETQWGDVETMQKTMSAASVGVQGSGWGWLGYDKTSNKLAIATTPNQDPLLTTTGLIPLFGIDVWEHAYYLDYKNVRPDYVNEIWKAVNWKDVEANLKAAK